MRLLIVVAILVACTACDPFKASGLAVDQDISVPQNQVASVRLLVSDRRLPPSARNVHIRILHFQDTQLFIRFDAATAEARAFAERLIGRPLNVNDRASMGAPDDIAWWISAEDLERAEKGEDRIVHDDGRPAVCIALIARGDTATVWLLTFTV